MGRALRPAIKVRTTLVPRLIFRDRSSAMAASLKEAWKAVCLCQELPRNEVCKVDSLAARD
jgi:hypothetical protein